MINKVRTTPSHHSLGTISKIVPDRRIALVEFRRREDAESFMDKYQPTISFPLEHSKGRDSEVLTFDIHFARRNDGDHSRGQHGTESNWYCQIVSNSRPPLFCNHLYTIAARARPPTTANHNVVSC